jgi:hypothetical protein
VIFGKINSINMERLNPGNPQESSLQKLKTRGEYRADFIKKYEYGLGGEARWVEDDKGEREGRVYNIEVEPKAVGTDSIDTLAKFWLMARQAGYQIVDRIEIPNLDYGGGPSKGVVHQFHLEGTPLSVSMQGQ